MWFVNEVPITIYRHKEKNYEGNEQGYILHIYSFENAMLWREDGIIHDIFTLSEWRLEDILWLHSRKRRVTFDEFPHSFGNTDDILLIKNIVRRTQQILNSTKFVSSQVYSTWITSILSSFEHKKCCL